MIVAAGNPPEYNKSVREFDVVTMDRVKRMDVEADFEVWKEYAYRQGLHGAVISYLNARKQNFYQMETTVDGRNFATPRGWEDLSDFIQVYEKLGKTADREVVTQYIQFPKIAKDFANYLELYEKYQTDYQLEEIFQGRLDEILLKKIAHASFDERLSVLGLILSRVNEMLKKSVQHLAYMEQLHSCLLELKELTESDSGNGAGSFEAQRQSACNTEIPDGQQLLDNIYNKINADYIRLKAAELLGREADQQYQKVLRTMERFGQTLKLEGIREKHPAFLRMKELFALENEAYERQQQQSLETLEYAFDFLEGAFGTGQEMVMFITELNSNYYSVKFLESCDCERYYQYNQELLFDEKRRKLLERLS